MRMDFNPFASVSWPIWPIFATANISIFRVNRIFFALKKVKESSEETNKTQFQECILRGLSASIPFLVGICLQYLLVARDRPRQPARRCNALYFGVGGQSHSRIRLRRDGILGEGHPLRVFNSIDAHSRNLCANMHVTWESDGLWIWKCRVDWTVAVGEDPRSISRLVRVYRKLLKLYA